MLISGKTIDAEEALRLGILNQIYSSKLPWNPNQHELFINHVMDYAVSNAVQNNFKNIVNMPNIVENISDSVWSQLEESIRQNAKGQLAPIKLFECVKSVATTENIDYDIEEIKLNEFAKHPQAQALQYIHFAEKKSIVKSYQDGIQTVGVIGGGTMGCGIVMTLLDAKIPVVLIETSIENVQKALLKIENTYKASSAFKNGKLTANDVTAKLGILNTSTDYQNLKDVDLVIEAIFENMDLKKSIFKELDKVCKPNTVLATNTSYLSIDEIANVTNRKTNVIGTRKFIIYICQ